MLVQRGRRNGGSTGLSRDLTVGASYIHTLVYCAMLFCSRASGGTGLEASLAKTAGRYSVGDDITMADLCLIPQVYNAKRFVLPVLLLLVLFLLLHPPTSLIHSFDVNVEAYPTISRVHDALSQLDAVKASHPQRQPDCPAELRA